MRLNPDMQPSADQHKKSQTGCVRALVVVFLHGDEHGAEDPGEQSQKQDADDDTWFAVM